MPSPLTVHDTVFVPTLQSLASPEQQKLVEEARLYHILGAYAQTEIGHGSNVKGLETTATFDETTDEFVLHSPTLTSTKFWVGCLVRIERKKQKHKQSKIASKKQRSIPDLFFFGPPFCCYYNLFYNAIKYKKCVE